MDIAAIPAPFRPSPTAVRVLSMNTGDAVKALSDDTMMRDIIGEMSAHFARRAAASQKAAATRAKRAEVKERREHARVVDTRCGECFQIPAASGACWC